MNGKKLIVLAVILVLSLGAYVNEVTASPNVLTTCGNVGAGSHVLGNNISTTGDCFILTGNDITIDLNGFTITGDDDLNDRGIWDGGIPRENIVIRNGTIRDFNQGIEIGASDGCKVEGITAFSNGAGIIVGDHCHVSHNIAINNRNAGIHTGTDSTVSYNIANNNNSGIGLNLSNVRSSIIYNTTNGNVNIGINVACPSNLIGNIAQNNGTNLFQQLGTCKRYDNLF